MRNSKYWVRIAANGRPVMGSLIERTKKPNGNFVDITSCLGLCCTFNTDYASPGNFSVADGATGEIVATWSAVTGATTYKLERATNSTFTAGLTTVQNTSGTSKTDTVTSGVHYYYRVSVIDSNGNQGGFAYADQVAP